ncbi:MAG: DoxX family membrane protein [Calditrichaeota bacterium]|nr:DoxX family membrane protein [Calditrichota bacterium]
MTDKGKSRLINWLLRIIIAGIFIYAGAVKIANPAGFAEQVDNYRILPYFFVVITAVVLPWLELICGMLLLTSRCLSASALILLVLNFIFIVAIASALVRGLDISCGCFAVGAEETKIGMQKLAEDIVLLAMNVVIYRNSLK